MIAAWLPAQPGRARRPGAGAAEGQISGAVGRREPRRAARWPRVLGVISVALPASLGESRIVFYVGYALAIAGRAAARSAAVAGAVAGPPAGAQVAAAGRRRAGRRQPDPVAAPHVGERRRPDAVAGAGDRVRRHGARQLRARSSTGWTSALNPDLFVTPSQDIVIRTLRFPREHGGGARGGARRRSGSRRCAMPASCSAGIPVMIVATDIASLAEDSRRCRRSSGDAQRRCTSVTAAGAGLMVSDNFAQLQRLTLGDMLEIPAPHGADPPAHRRHRHRLLRSAGHHPDGPDGVRAATGTTTRSTSFRVYLASRSAGARGAAAILERYAGQRQVFVLTNGELKAYILRITDQWFGLTSVQIAVAVLVAILGIVNTLTVSITDRRRELGVLQGGRRAARTDPPAPSGWRRSASARSAWCSASRSGAVNLYYILQIVQRDIAGMRLDYVFPVVGGAGAGADDSRRGVRCGDLAGRVRGPRLARGGARV